MKGAVILSIYFGLGHPAVWCSLSLIKKAQMGHIRLRAPTRISQSCTRALALSRSSDICPTGVLIFPWVNSAHFLTIFSQGIPTTEWSTCAPPHSNRTAILFVCIKLDAYVLSGLPESVEESRTSMGVWSRDSYLGEYILNDTL